ncbi:MAG: proprotein convertase P-domain-containing protein [Bacteroidia bacterium]
MKKYGLSMLGLFACIMLTAQTIDLDKVARYSLPIQDNQALLAAENARSGPGIAPQFAVSLPVSINPSTHGTWEDLGNGQLMWRMRVFSAKAKSLNLGFTDFYMPLGGTMRLYSPDMNTIQGPFSPADNESHGQLWTPIVNGEELVIEVVLPVNVKNQLLLHLGYVNHDFLGFGLRLSGSCNLDVNCGLADGFGIVDEYRDIIRSVGVYGLNGNTFCTGFLINNTGNDCRPFFMTANHCGLNNGNAASMVVYWNFENSTCRQPLSGASGGNGDGQLNQFNSGAIYRAGWAGSDFALVELDDEVPTEYLPFFAGFDATNGATGDSVIGIHHPATDEKRISFEFDPTNIGDDNGNATPNGNYVIVNDWDIGTTEGGSSGSPLFNKQKRVIGQLLGGGAACGNNLEDIYGWVHRSWTGGGSANSRLQDWLDPGNTGLMTMDGRDCGTAVLVNPITLDVCSPADALYNLQMSEGFIDSVQLSISGLPNGVTTSFTQNPVIPGGSSDLSLTNLSSLLAGSYNFTLSGTDGIDTSTQVLTLIISQGVPIVNPLSPTNNELGVIPFATLEWAAIPLTQYIVELAADSNFINIIAMASVQGGQWSTGSLAEETPYYWRLRGTNACGQGNHSPIQRFTTGALFCETTISTDVPKSISQGGGSTITSSLIVSEIGLVEDLNLRNLNIDHTWVGDLTITLTSPQGTEVILLDQIDCNQDDIVADFDDQATMTQADLANNCGFSTPAISGAFQPLESLSAFIDDSTQGIWTMTITDNFFGDGGALNAWELQFCRAEKSAIQAIPDTIELCLGEGADFDLLVGNAFNNNPGVVVTLNDLPVGVNYTVSSVPTPSNTMVTVSLTPFNVAGQYEVQINGLDGMIQRSAKLVINVSTEPQAALLLPADGATQVVLSPILKWLSDYPADSFRIELSLDTSFNTVVQVKTSLTDSVILDPLSHAVYYYWRVHAYNDCGTRLSSTQVFATEWATGLANTFGFSVEMYPNPARDHLNLALESPLGKELQWEIINLTGQKLASGSVAVGQVKEEIALSQWPAGVYFIRLSHEGSRFTERFLIQK